MDHSDESTDSTKMHVKTSWDELGYQEVEGSRVTKYNVGLPGDENAPAVFRVYYPPGFEVPAHSHPSDYTEIFLSGTQKISGRWYQAGDLRIVSAGTAYGPTVTGPEGCTVLAFFRTNQWTPVPVTAGEGMDVFDQLVTGFSVVP